MDLTSLIERLVSSSDPKKDLAEVGHVPGLSEVFFRAIYHAYGADPSRIESLGKIWKLIRDRGDDPSWAWRAGGVVERGRGRWRSSADAFMKAGQVARTPVHKYSFSVGAIDSLARLGKLHEAEALADRLGKGLLRLGEPGLAARAWLNLGNALVYQDQSAKARASYKKALPLLEAPEFRIEYASALLGLSSVELFGGSPKKAIELAEAVGVLASEIEADFLVELSKLNLAIADVLLGRSESAYRKLTELRATTGASPVEQQRVSEYLGDASYRLNLWSEAIDCYESALASNGPLIPMHRGHIHLGLGQALLALGKLGEAETEFIQALSIYRRLRNAPWSAAALLGRASILKEGGNSRASDRILRRALELTNQSPYHRCEVLLALGARDGKSLEQAQSLIRRHGYAGLAWRVHYERALKSETPLRHYRKMFDSILESRLLTTSTGSRMTFLRDKSHALRSYLGLLLESPTRSRTKEAYKVVEQSRAVTLLDEIASAGGLAPEVQARLAQLRQSISESPNEPEIGGNRRLLYRNATAFRRVLTPSLPVVGLIRANSERPGGRGLAVVVDTLPATYFLTDVRVQRLSCDPTLMKKQLRWLAYELLAPMACPDAKPELAMRALAEVADRMGEFWSNPSRVVCPDGHFWQLPWTALAMSRGIESEYAIAMHPSFAEVETPSVCRETPVTVWLGKTDNLPFAHKELEGLRSLFRNVEVIDSLQEARSSLRGEIQLLHVISHAVHRGQNPMFSSIEFADGPLFAMEIAGSQGDVGLAVLSACETGTMSVAIRDEPDGLARAFLACGAQSVIGSQWPLDDEAAAIQFIAFYAALLTGLSLSESLIRARCICRDAKPHPYYWGALALYAGYSK